MKSIKKLLPFVMLGLMLASWKVTDKNWIIENYPDYTIRYSAIDKNNISEYLKLINTGISNVRLFFNSPYKNRFGITIHPDRQSLDSSWQVDWNMPDFKSECWMIASGVAAKMDILSPKLWDSQSCEHKYNDSKKTQQLVTHELVHVYHGQLNESPDFSNTQGIDWFVEGLAVYASGQCDSAVISKIKHAISSNKIPERLDDFWTGKLKYGLSGSVVLFIDKKYGRETILKLLPLNKKTEILAVLNISESDLLFEWCEFMQKI